MYLKCVQKARIIMKLAIIGSRSITAISMEKFIDEYTEKNLTEGITEIVSGGAPGVDTLARELAKKRGIPLVELLPDYRRFGRGAPLKRNEKIAEYADEAIAFWDGRSKGTEHTISLFWRLNKKIRIVLIEPTRPS